MITLIHPLLLALSTLPLYGQALPKAPAKVDPAAARVLDSMVKAYRSISKLHQESVYSAGEGKTPPLIRSRLVLARPNRIVLDMTQPGIDRPQPYRLLYQCDGRDMYAYQETKGFYTKEKAPRNLKELDYLAVTIEMAAIIGTDPVSQFVAQSRVVRMGEPQLADNVMSDTVIFEMGGIGRQVELRLSIGQADHLLRKFDYTSTPVPKPQQEKPKDRIIVGDPDGPPPPVEKPEEPVRLSYENHVFQERDLPKDAFKWIEPPGSFAYQDYPSLLNPKGGTAGAVGGTGGVMPAGTKPMKITKFEDLMKKAWKNQKR